MKTPLFIIFFCILYLNAVSQKKDSTQVQNVASVPPPGGGGCTPPTNPGNPTASTNTCGNKTLTRSGTPPTGVRWYWQTSSGGTSLDYGGSTFTATQSGTYYIRAYKYACDMWGSGGGYINVTVNNPGAPFTPTVTDYCSSVVLTRGAPPSGITWYWQDMSSSGTSTANSAATYTAYSSGTYYIRSYHNATGCWGASNSVSVTLTQGPTAPPTPLASGGCGQANLSWNGSPAQFIRWCWQTSPGGTDMSTMGSAYTVYSSGTYYLRAYDLNTQCWSPASQISVTVYPLPNAAASDQTICSGQTTSVPVANPNGISGTTFSWTVSQTNTSGAAAGSGSTISQALYATTASTGYATYTIIPGANGCNGSPITVAVNVKPTPTAAASDQTICSGQQTSISITNPEGISTATFSWTASQANASGAENGSGSSISQILTATTNVPGTVTYSITPSANGCVGPPISRVATVNPRPNASVPAQHYIFSDNTTSISITNPNNVAGTTFAWTATATDVTGMSNGSGPTIQQPLTSVSGGTVNYTITPTANGCFGDPTSTTVNVYPRPIITSTAQRVALDQVTLSTTTGGYDGYTWKNGINEIGNTATIKTSSPGSYTVTVTKMGATGSSLSYILNDQFAGQNANYIISNAALVKGITDATTITNRTVDDVSQTVQYFDGLGRPIQTVTTQGSPKKKDIVQPVVYDKYGREEKKYLPFVANETSGWFKEDVINSETGAYQNAAAGFYTTGAGGIANDLPFSAATFESSPLNRIEKEGFPGSAWQPDSNPYATSTDHAVKYSYDFNLPSDVLLLTCSLPPNDTALSIADGSATTRYNAHELVKTRTKDEEQHEVIEYKDKLGRVVLQSVEGPSSVSAQTYYIYDDFGNLLIVLPPEATKRLSNEYFELTDVGKDSFLRRWAFRYRYDDRNRMIMKQLPGSSAIYMVYDGRDRLVLTQDGNQRTLAINQWIFTKYDAFNRPVMTGIFKDSLNRNQQTMESFVNTFYTNAIVKWYEQEGSSVHGYTNRSFPNVGLPEDYNTITYYDNYNFRDDYAGADYDFKPTDFSGQITSPLLRVMGNVTGSKTRVLGTSEFLWSATYYEDHYRPIQSINGNHLGGIDVSTSIYDFTGKVVKTKITHYNSSRFLLAMINSNDYDHVGHLTKTFNAIEQSPSWANVSGLTITGDVITKTAISNSWNAGAFSANGLPTNGDGYVQFKVDQTDKAILVGFSESEQGINSTIQYAAHPDLDGTYYARAGGAYHGPFGSYSAGDIFTVERKNETIFFKRNGQVYYTCESGSLALFVDIAIHGQGGTIRDVRLNRTGEVQIVENKYNELGQLVTKKLHSEDQGSSFKQHEDYRYNIRGWLTRINNSDLTRDDPNESQDYFGMEFGYNNDLGIGEFTPQYNGNITAVKWSTNIGLALPYLNEPTERAYKFSYDPMNRLITANHATKSGTWSESKAYQEIANYDLNGNIQTLLRSNSGGGLIDWLAYNYGLGASAGNRLLSVTDNGIITEGFKDGNTVENDYKYDANGNLISDANKNIVTIKYNSYLNETEEIVKRNGEKVKTIYDAEGLKLAEEIYQTGAQTPIMRTDFVGPFVYENDTLKYIIHKEGKIIIPKDSFETPEYQYQIKDHLGNVRLTFSTKEKTEEFKATMEDTGVADYGNPRVQEMTHFGNLFETEIRNVSQWLNHTSNAIGNAIYLDGSEDLTVGPYSLLKVYPGDTVKMEVFGKYEKKQTYNTNSLAMLLASLVSPVETAAVTVDGGTSLTATGLMDGLTPFLSTKASDTDAPGAYINYILFDKHFDVVDLGFDPIDESAGFDPGQENTVGFDKMELQRIIDRVGYIYIYVSNESEGTRVWMDDIKITYGKSPIVQFEDYYPFGLSQSGTAFERGNDKYQGMVTTDGTGLKDLGFRQYDAALGRFQAIDPLAELQVDQSTHQYAGNNPVTQIDVLGLETDDVLGLQTDDHDPDKDAKKRKLPKRDHQKKEQRAKEKKGYSRYQPNNTNNRRNSGKNTQTARNRKQSNSSRSSAKKHNESASNNQGAAGNTGNTNESGRRDPDPGHQTLVNLLFYGPGPTSDAEQSDRLRDPANVFNNANSDNRKNVFENSVIPPSHHDDYQSGSPSVIESAELADETDNIEQYREHLYRNHSTNEARALFARMLVIRNYQYQSNKTKDNVSAISNTLTNDDKASKEPDEQLSREQLKNNPGEYRALTTELLRQKMQQQCPTCEQWKINIAAGNALEYAWERMSGIKRNFGSKFWNNIRSKAVRPDFLYEKREHTTDENGKPDIFFYDDGVFVEVKASQNTIDKETSNKQIWAELEVLSRKKNSGINDLLGETLGESFGGKKAPDGVLTFLLVVTEGTVVDQSLIDQATQYGITFYVSYAYENIQTGGVVFSTPEKRNFFGSAAGEGSQWDAIRHEGINQPQEGVPLESDRANKFIQHSNEYDETQP